MNKPSWRINLPIIKRVQGKRVPYTKKDSLSVHEYGLKFTQFSRYAPEMVKDMSSRMKLFVAGLGRASRKEVRSAMMIDGMDISLLIVYVQQVEDEKLREREEYRKKKSKTRNEFKVA